MTATLDRRADVKAISLELRGISKAFGVQGRIVQALRDVTLDADAQELVCVVGPSGCGKSTLLNMICGLLRPDAGDILLDGDAGADRLGRVGYMPQQDLLLPWRTVMDNILLGPEIAGEGRAEARAYAETLLPLFGLQGFVDQFPATLSGGMRQRAALMRTFLCRRGLVLLDEPFGALDALTRRVMRGWLLRVWREFGQTVVLVTHDVDEAVFCADKVFVMSARPGSIVHRLDIPLPRPRRESMTTGGPFLALRRELFDHLGVTT